MKLLEVRKGMVKVRKISKEIVDRLISMNVLEGMEIEVLRNDGEIIIIRVMDKIFGLDKNIAKRVEVDEV